MKSSGITSRWRVVVFALAIPVFLLAALTTSVSTAGAWHADISGKADCKAVVTFTLKSWSLKKSEGSNEKIDVDYRVDGGAWQRAGTYKLELSKGNVGTYSFTVANHTKAMTVDLKASTNNRWGDGTVDSNWTREARGIKIPAPCVTTTTVPPTTMPPTTVPKTVPPTTVPKTVPPTTVPKTVPPTTVPKTVPPTTVPKTVPPTTVPKTVPPTTVPKTVPPTTMATTTTTPMVTTPPTTVPPTGLPTTLVRTPPVDVPAPPELPSTGAETVVYVALATLLTMVGVALVAGAREMRRRRA